MLQYVFYCREIGLDSKFIISMDDRKTTITNPKVYNFNILINQDQLLVLMNLFIYF